MSVDLSSRPFKITTNTSTILAQSVVIATGADSRWLGVPGEEELKGGGPRLESDPVSLDGPQ